MIFESHTHLDDKQFDDDREQLLASFTVNGIGRAVNVAASMESVESTMLLAGQYSSIYAALGVHPSDTAQLTEEDMEHIKTLCADTKVVAIGEIGLDYYWDTPNREIQKKWFRRQLELADELALPVIIHSRDAARDTADILHEFEGRLHGGIIHCYSYSKEMAAEFSKMGFSFGIGGVVTFRNARTLQEVVAYLPLERIVVETDSPYLAPVPNRSKRNSPLNLRYIIEQIAQIKGLTADEVEAATWDNACRIFKC